VVPADLLGLEGPEVLGDLEAPWRPNRPLRSLGTRRPSRPLRALRSLRPLRPRIALRPWGSWGSRGSYQSVDVNNTQVIGRVNHHRHYRPIEGHSINASYVRRSVNCRVTDSDCARLAGHTAIADVDIVITGSQIDTCARTQRDVAVTSGVKNSANVPLAVLPPPVVLLKSAPAPLAEFWSALLERSVPAPTPMLNLPSTLLLSENKPMALLYMPVVRLKRAF
jgi:hypothetical protein